MSEVLSRERVGKFAAYAGLALGLSAAVKLFVELRGTSPTEPQSGGWEDLPLTGAEPLTVYDPSRLAGPDPIDPSL